MAPRTFLHLSRAIRPLTAPKLHKIVQPRPFTTCLPSGHRSTEGGKDNPQRDAQKDREKMNTDATEYAKSGTDDTAAQNEEAAFDPNITSPEGAREKAGEGNEENPLDTSPANLEVSKGTSEEDGGAKKKGSL